ncbi:MAG TPA: GAK system CofD-like protein [Humidesulfovibrio sp.]|uniref:GAK system CofD-like protein n=1 Tax=Humidesulfovibrio sp. TaxID=2910988 RepID=UPI002C14D321|nr:GAK system CofD-like protein [Humidesulfovibrio sp.]HWR05068.1 GAK system CofD-like protein [Humidesulfovibrio sp.]
MAKTWIRREVEIPNHMALARLEKCPELGPKLLFFSGGTALKRSSARLVNYTHNSIHVITPFDSGGSSAEIRRAFNMPAVGDIRNRLMALADQSLRGNPEIFALFAHRLPKGEEQEPLRHDLDQMVRGRHELVARIPDPMRKIVRNHLAMFQQNMPEDFDLNGASIGNLVLAGGYLANRRHLDPVIFMFSNLVQVRGTVRPVVNKNLHLAAELADGALIIGQHRLTGKETARLTSPITRLYLSDDTGRAVDQPIRDKMRTLIQGAELICYPMGSFHSSVLANLLPRGVGQAVAGAACSKIYVPSTGDDPECLGLSVADQVERLGQVLMADAPGIRLSDVLHFVLVDTAHGHYPGGLDLARIRNLGVEVIDCPLIGYGPSPDIDDRFLVPILLSLA